MLYLRPDYYEKFKCIAGNCPATCCAGWQIVVDEESLGRYEQEDSDYGRRLRDNIDWAEGVFKQDAHKRCAFLNKDNLCDMYKHLGEKSLCTTCTNYPRHIEEFENIREVTLSISCPEVARIILALKEPVVFVEEEVDSDEEEFEDFDPFFFSYLEDARKILIDILQNRSLSVETRAFLVQHMTEELQECIETSQLFDLVDIFEKYEDEDFLTNAVKSIEKEWYELCADSREYYDVSKSIFSRLYELEHLSEQWEPYLEHCWKLLYENKDTGVCRDGNAGRAENFAHTHMSFRNWCCSREIEKDFELDIVLEQLLVYFVSTYFCGAVYDDNISGKMQLTITSIYVLYEMFVAKWLEQDGTLSRRDMETIVYRYSRELEHSDINLELIENLT